MNTTKNKTPESVKKVERHTNEKSTPLPDMELPLECVREYDAAAEWCANRGLKGEIGDPLPANMNPEGALKYINADPEAFQQRVREFAYEKAMKSVSFGDTSKPFVEKCRDLTNDKYDHSTAALMEKYNREMLALLNKEIGK